MKIQSNDSLAGWKVVVGDAIRATEGEPPVIDADIKTVDTSDYSELQANIQPRGIMAHNITYLEDVGDENLTAIHACRYQFQLVDEQVPDRGRSWLGETVEGGVFVWDGKNTRRDYGLAFQWVVNPWDKRAGTLNSWNGSAWEPHGMLALDQKWHEVWMVLDVAKKTATLIVDGMPIETTCTSTEKAESWARETVGRLQAEIVSINPGEQPLRVPHRARFRDWAWTKNTKRV